MTNIIECSVLVLAILSISVQSTYTGILLNGPFGGTQIYDPFNAPHAQGNLDLRLPNAENANGGGAVINGNMAYFASGSNFQGISIILHQ
jgi:hypothetical protein